MKRCWSTGRAESWWRESGTFSGIDGPAFSRPSHKRWFRINLRGLMRAAFRRANGSGKASLFVCQFNAIAPGKLGIVQRHIGTPVQSLKIDICGHIGRNTG